MNRAGYTVRSMKARAGSGWNRHHHLPGMGLLAVSRTGALYLTVSSLMYRSEDAGQTWSDAELLPDGMEAVCLAADLPARGALMMGSEHRADIANVRWRRDLARRPGYTNIDAHSRLCWHREWPTVRRHGNRLAPVAGWGNELASGQPDASGARYPVTVHGSGECTSALRGIGAWGSVL